MEGKIWKPLRELDDDRSTFKNETSMLLLRRNTDCGKEYKLLEYYAVEEMFYDPTAGLFEEVNVYDPQVEYINLDVL